MCLRLMFRRRIRPKEHSGEPTPPLCGAMQLSAEVLIFSHTLGAALVLAIGEAATVSDQHGI